MPGHHTEIYYSLIQSLIADQEQIWGKQAIELADSISGLHVSDADSIWVNGNEKRIAGMLAETYIEKFGQAAESSLLDAASDFQEDVTLPSVLQS